jgi:hypothetical protein
MELTAATRRVLEAVLASQELAPPEHARLSALASGARPLDAWWAEELGASEDWVRASGFHQLRAVLQASGVGSELLQASPDGARGAVLHWAAGFDPWSGLRPGDCWDELSERVSADDAELVGRLWGSDLTYLAPGPPDVFLDFSERGERVFALEEDGQLTPVFASPDELATWLVQLLDAAR